MKIALCDDDEKGIVQHTVAFGQLSENSQYSAYI